MQAALEIDELPPEPLAAAGWTYCHLQDRIERIAEGENRALAILLPLADQSHDGWRRALARDLARAHAPMRINLVGGGSADACAQTLAFLTDAPGVTGQYFALEG